jgi:hypothetical protein
MRNKKTLTIAAKNRDQGKTFLITELPAALGEDWAIRALRLAQRSGADIPGGLSSGMAGVAALGILAVLEGTDNINELRPLFKEMMACVQIMTDLKTQFTRPLVEDAADDDNNDIQEISTRVLLRKEWLDLHLDFSIADALSELTKKTATSAI